MTSFIFLLYLKDKGGKLYEITHLSQTFPAVYNKYIYPEMFDLKLVAGIYCPRKLSLTASINSSISASRRPFTVNRAFLLG